jgi:hypothetical protein
MRPRRKQSGGSLDSLLDTMTNVVGILVIVLVVTQLGVHDAVDRISTSEAKELAKLQLQVREAEAELAPRLEDYKDRDPEQMIERLKELARQIADAKADLAGLVEMRRAAEAESRKPVEEAKQLIEQQRKAEQELKRQIVELQTAVASLEARLAEAPKREIKPPKIVQIPNPRPAPEGAQPVTFYCRQGRVALLDLPGSQNRAAKWADYQIRRRRLGDPAKGVECDKLFADFHRERFRDKNFELKLEARGRYPYIVFVERENWGETVDEILALGSDYREVLARIDARRFYIRFLVWPDSFEAYIAARQIASDEGLPAGWEPQTRTDEYRVRLESNLRCGPPPPPRPKPRPKPGEKPAPPRPPQPPRQFPDDVID